MVNSTLGPKAAAILVFTQRSVDELRLEGGSQAWALNADRARRCEFLVCAQNRYGSNPSGTAPHGSAFCVGKISSVEAAPEDASRSIIRVSALASVSVPNVWQHWRNPVKYSTLDDMGIDLSTLSFEPAQNPAPVVSFLSKKDATIVDQPLSIEAAKRGLARYFGVPLDTIKITING